ncbi:unnamed protein product [Gongylonema pulchrum]|uniref:Uncharacterized protein n=1 Tax=Gongylonema pulchrum TaxID=637853 RepID=A0A183CUZ9_9BILA|nr:unnamed protein product [Gongylonema pulchrum]
MEDGAEQPDPSTVVWRSVGVPEEAAAARIRERVRARRSAQRRRFYWRMGRRVFICTAAFACTVFAFHLLLKSPTLIIETFLNALR